ncbi:uncharacterized protein BO72DRAFT_483031 [Aspergillus fijiensis CBS 313.89]|uniref:Uncharacterized protein n=1 Tax=Aspergillus fijiensis CBS 313.89 TaxID=1448319 RepID=A0A8G1S0U1_9EURO|nr:uncharacterized protein BO72DRAFT_483031 [Aspergillus fijiensis CBS 313.89]RAK81325.1 hypothetical protein BO72DRAFT_483031 [Aspergillus fijiensis CBS 313.89]
MATFKGPIDRRLRETPPPIDERNVADDSGTDPEIREPKRQRQLTSQPYFVDPTRIQIGSSSPLHSDSCHGSQPSSLGYVDHDTHSLARAPEDATLRLASCVIRHIVYYAASQDSTSQAIVVEFRDAKSRLAPKTPTGGLQMIAIDDGGLCLQEQKPDGGFMFTNNHVAVLEAKPHFQCLENGRPVISDGNLAQMICQALATRCSYLNVLSQQSVIVINATQHYLCFLQVDIGNEYLYNFEGTSPRHMFSTPWFDLSQRSGRESILANLCGIMRRAISV